MWWELVVDLLLTVNLFRWNCVKCFYHQIAARRSEIGYCQRSHNKLGHCTVLHILCNVCVVQWNRKWWNCYRTDVIHLRLHLMCWNCSNLFPPIFYPNIRISELGYYTNDHGTHLAVMHTVVYYTQGCQAAKNWQLFVQRFVPFLATISIRIRTTLVQILPFFDSNILPFLAIIWFAI